MERAELIELIEAAFDGVPQPPELTLHVAEAHDDYDYDRDAEHRRKDHIGRWQDVPWEHIERCTCALSYLDPVGMRYYLPAHMVWYLKNFGSTRVKFDSVLYLLGYEIGDASSDSHFRDTFSLFSANQLRACALFVKYCAEDETNWTDVEFATQAYIHTWSRFESGGGW
ncbi:MAG: hypothetical protein NXI24_08645 [bacterium]|nr:hypothetical protein [bacterium]